MPAHTIPPCYVVRFDSTCKVESPDEWTEIAVESVDYDIDLPDSLFKLSNLRNPRE